MKINNFKNGFKIDYENLKQNEFIKHKQNYKKYQSDKNFLCENEYNDINDENDKREQLLQEEYEIKMSEIINGIVISENNILFIPLENINSSICYFISAIQRLHSSSTLNEKIKNCDLKHLIKNYDVAKDVELTLSSLKHYANINEDNISKIFENITQDHKILFECVFNQNMFHGGDPYKVLIWLLFPLLYMEFGITIVKTIINEINFDTNRFSGINIYKNNEHNVISIIENGFNRLEPFFRRETTNKFLKEANKCFISELNNYVSNINQREHKNKFVVGNMSLFFNDENGEPSKFPGHAVVIIKNKEGNYMVLDDAVNIREISNYVQQCGRRIHKLEFKDIADEDIQNIKKLLEPCSVDARIYRTIINFSGAQNFSGGYVEDIEDVEDVEDIEDVEDEKPKQQNLDNLDNLNSNSEQITTKQLSRDEIQKMITDSIYNILDDIDYEKQHKESENLNETNNFNNVNSLNNSNNSQNIKQIQNICDSQNNQQINQNEISKQQINKSIHKINSFYDIFNCISNGIWKNRSFIEKCLLIIMILLIISIIVFIIVNIVKCKKTKNDIKKYQNKLDKIKKDLKINYSIYNTYISNSDNSEELTILPEKDILISKESFLSQKQTNSKDNILTSKPIKKVENIVKEYGSEILHDINKFSENKPMNILDLRNSEVLNKIITKTTYDIKDQKNNIVNYNTQPFKQSNDYIF